MPAMEIKPGIHWVGAMDWDRRLFDELIPLPDGTTYNSYLVRGNDKIALIDTVDPMKEKTLLDNLHETGVEKIDYLITHHAEQDHSGTIPRILELYPMVKVVCTPKCKDQIKILLHVSDDRIITVADGETLDLGGRTLEFIHAQWVHWPETMLTYLREDKILFSCDFLGSHLTQSDLYATDEAKVLRSAKRYYAEIMMPFRSHIVKHLERLAKYDIQMVCPSHGPIYPKPSFIIDAYKDWTSEKPKKEVVLAYVSMHGSTQMMADRLVDALMKRGIPVKPFNLSRTDIGELAMDLVDASTIVIGTPTVLGGAHPLAVYAAYLANALRPKARFVSIIGSYGWGGKTVEQLAGMIGNLKVEVIEPVLIKGMPTEEDYSKIDALADAIAKKHADAGIE
ncbi:MAG: FprA family A-type flavoprotein [Candidatus Thermoplasmatota archaeon]|nr:FprA family A-type flavoprotein [Euryarchaeota archaeon]MBU4032408.1 FprA family A-type flavoprotein [Candidatus Thermoplasmatota archaeon]MBU4143682.1 FprA family A-type flavoprotein [Candidatus Thermoplasmatota archaeon]MBU4591804.1 FprA family A-type flavoprotein [Candidatus Thermoplasmatota archaeon]